MAAVLAGEAAVRVVPTLRGFHNRVASELKRQPHSIQVKVDPNFTRAETQMAAWRKRQEANALNIPVRAKTDLAGFTRDIRQVEHVFKRSSLSRAIRLNIKVIGLDALPALAYAAGSAASGLDALGKSAFALPGIMGGALASVGALAVGLQGVSDAFKAYGEDAADAADNARKVRDADRDLISSKRDLKNAIRDQRREIEDLNTELRRSSLNEADALLNVQEAVERLREGGFKNITEFQRAQLGLLQSVDRLNEVRKGTVRTAQDVAQANADGVEGSDRVADALDRVAKATEALDDSKVSKVSEALAKLAPNVAATVEAVHGFSGAWTQLQQSVANNLFEDLDRVVTNLGNRGLPVLQDGLSKVATGLNTNLKSIAGSLGSDQNLGLFDRIFGNTKGGLENLSKGMDPLISGFAKLTEVSSRFLPRLGDAFAQVTTRFENFVSSAADDGRLEKWIDQGLDALTSLGNAAINVGSIVSSIGEAFNAATGTQGGFIGSLERGTARLAEFLKSTEGQNTLVSYFQRAKEFVTGIIDALRGAKVFLNDVVETTREWSQGFFAVVGALTRTAAWIEKNTGLLKPLLAAYLTIRTARPIIEGLTGAWKLYGATIGALANNTGFFSSSAKGMQQFKSQLSAIGGVAPGAASKIQLNAAAIQSVNKQAFAALAPANNLTQQFGTLGNTAATAGTKIGGGAGAAGKSLGGALVGLGRFIGPGLAFTGAIIGLTALITELGKAHESAARDADRQKVSLDQLKSSLDSVTGAATQQSLNQNARSLGSYDIPGLGNRNVGSDAARANIGTPEQILAATIPTQQAARDDLLGKADKETESKIASSELWTRYGPLWQSNGVSLETLAKAANGDPAAKAKVEEVRKKLLDPTGKGMVPDWVPGSATANQAYEAGQVAGGQAPPDLTQTIKDTGAFDSASTGIFIRDRSQTAVNEGNAIKGASDLAFGKGTLNAAGIAAFGADGQVTLNDQGLAVIQTSQEPNVPPELGQKTKTAFGWQVQLTDSGTGQFVQKLAGGGPVHGKGTGTSDSNLTMLSKGEFVTKKKAVDHYGQTFFDDLNSMRLPKFQTGGGWGFPKPPPPRPVAPRAGFPTATPAPVAPRTPNIFNMPLGPRPQTGPVFPGLTPARPGLAPGPFGLLPGSRGSAAPIGPNPSTILNRPIPPFQDMLEPGLQRQQGNLGGRTGQGLNKLPTPLKDFSGRLPSKPAPWTPNPNAKIPPLLKKPGPRSPSATTSPTGVKTYPALTASGQPSTAAIRGLPTHPGSSLTPPTGTTAPHGGDGTPGTPTPAGPGLPSTGPINPVAPNPALANGPLFPGGRTGAEGGLQVNTLKLKRAIEQAFPEIQTIGGVRPDSLQWHPNGLALDVMIPGAGGLNDPTPPEGKALGDRIWQWVQTNGQAFGFDPGASIWQQKDHFNHLHLVTNGGGLPTGAEQLSLPGMAPLGVPPEIAALLPPGLIPGTGTGTAGFTPGVPEHLQPKAVTDFLGSTAQDVGSSLLSIGTQFLAGITGIDLSGLIGAGQEIGNFYAGKAGESSGGGGSSLNAEAGANMDAFANGELPTSLSPDVLSSLGIDPSTLGGLTPAGSNGQFGAEKWRPLVRQILAQVAPQYGITNVKAWEDALVKQIDTESKGNPGATNNSDSNGKGGTQAVNGLLQFLPSTFAAHNVSGGDYMDPVAQIYAAIDYVTSKYGMDGTGAPLQIGRGVGYKSGGLINGKGGKDSILARVSRGEFLTNPKAVKHYGAGTFAALNSMSVPRESLPGFNTGGFWNPVMPAPTPAPPPPATPAPPPQPAGPPPISGAPAPPAGPVAAPPSTLQIAQGAFNRTSSAPSTGGAPGPGATAPAPETSPLPQAADALAGLAGGSGGGNAAAAIAQPGASPSNEGDNRGTLGAAPASQDHTNPALKSGIESGAAHIGSLIATAASMGGGMAGMGAAGGAAGAGIQAGAQIAGKVASGAVNILSSLAVGSLTGGSTAEASGVPLLPQRSPMQTGVPPVQQQDNRTYNVTNLDEFQRLQQRHDSQAQMPYLSKF